MEFSSHARKQKTSRLSNLKIEIKVMSNGVRLAQPVFHAPMSTSLEVVTCLVFSWFKKIFASTPEKKIGGNKDVAAAYAYLSD